MFYSCEASKKWRLHLYTYIALLCFANNVNKHRYRRNFKWNVLYVCECEYRKSAIVERKNEHTFMYTRAKNHIQRPSNEEKMFKNQKGTHHFQSYNILVYVIVEYFTLY